MHDGVLAVVAGSIDDRAPLARVLSLPHDAPQHVLAAAAYRRWSKAMLSRLRGAFALLVWDGSRRDGLVAVDQLGARSIFYRRTGRSFAFGTDVRELLPLLETAPAPSERALVRWLVDGVHEPEETLLSGVARLAGGHLIRLEADTVRPERYWGPVYRPPQPLDRAASTAVVGAAAARAVTRACRRGRPVGVLLSGGLDSAAVAGLARAGGERAVAYSAAFPNHPATDERELVAARARLLELPAAFAAFRGGGALAATLRYLEAWRVPPASPNLFFHEALLSLARDEGVATLLDGQGGDEIFGLSRYLAADRLRAGRLLELRRLLRLAAAEGSPRRAALRDLALLGALPAGVHRLALRRSWRQRPPGWLTDIGAGLYGDDHSPWQWKATPAPRWWASLADAVTVARERGGVHDWLRHLFAGHDLRGGHPWLEDVDLVETVLALPPEHAWDERHDRPLLREAMRGVLPDPVRLRPDKSYFNDVLGSAVHVADAAAIDRLLDGRTEVSRYVRPELFGRLRSLPATRWGRRETWLLWRLVTLECWLREQHETGFLARAPSALALAEADVRLEASRTL